MLRAIPLLVVLLVVAAAVVLVITPTQQPRSERHNRRPSGSASTGLVVLGMLAVGVAVALGFGAGDAWPLLPIAIWIAIYLALREWARTRPQRDRAKAQQKMQEKRRHVDEFGADGVELMDRADAAVRRIMSSEAATQGWLGELDFTGDVSMIADTLRKVTALRTAAAEWAAIPNATADDDRMLRDAQRAAAKLKTAAAERVKVLHDCSLQAEQVDQTLHQQREQAAITQQRDDVRSRLDAMINGVERTSSGPPSDSTDAVKARVAAFLELKGIIEEQRRNQTAFDEP
jgi:hypothetical protein